MKKIISMLLMLCLVMGLCGMSAFAEDAPAQPEAKVSVISGPDNMHLNYALRFEAIEPEPEIRNEYGSWLADFVMVCSNDVTMCADDVNKMLQNNSAMVADGADGYIAGWYEGFPWIPVPFLGTVEDGGWNFSFNDKPINLKAKQPIGIMDTLMTALGVKGLIEIDYNFILDKVGVFECGIHFTPEFMAANAGMTTNIYLRLTNPEDGTEKIIGDVYTYVIPTPPPPPVPATADNSNMPLWGLLFIGFAAVAVLTGKKRRA